MVLSATSVLLAVGWRASPWYVGGVGAAGATLFAAVLFQLLYARMVEDRRRRRYLRALERLSEIATAITARLDAPREMLDAMARAARHLLEMDRSGVALLERGGDVLRVVASAGDVPSAFAQAYALSELPLCRSVIRSRKPLFIPDVRRSGVQLNAKIAQRFDARSLVLLPLTNGEKQLGLLALSSSRPVGFNDEQKRVAELLASQAAVVMSNSDLYGRMAEALRNQQVLFEQREAIFAVNAAVYQAATLQESLQMIAELAPGVLGVDLCMVTLNGDTEDRVRVAALTKPHGENLVGKNFIRRGTNGEVVRATRRALVIDEAAGHPGIHPAFRAHLDIGSIAYMPLLRTGGSFIGTLMLIRNKTGPFSPEQLNLAELFTVRAAAAIENAELLEQTRRDAQAKTMLLRELNHRVKNNLASIITLLSLDEPEMSPRARQWLHRAIDRIRTMARTHDLFSGGIDRVRLADLVQQTIPSLSVVRPASVDVQVDVRAEVTLRTDRAVSLAMALHELCYNAIIHGLGGGAGTVKIRAQLQELAIAGPVPQKGVLLEVVDDAMASRRASGGNGQAGEGALRSEAGGRSPVSVASRVDVELRPLPVRVGAGGLGLMLVDGLVTRELNGQFSLERSDEGTVARVWFPVGPEDGAG
jgi:two-component sensor histidine kinase